MARREKRKTSLGNVLELDAPHEAKATKDCPLHVGTSRVRISSDGSSRQPRPKLFRSVREAMEYEATENASIREMAVTLDARALNSLEKTQADEAGYTVIRRRAVSDLSEVRPPVSDSVTRHSRRRGKENKTATKTNAVQAKGNLLTTMTQPRTVSPRLASYKAEPGPSPEQDWLAAASAGAIQATATSTGSTMSDSSVSDAWKKMWPEASAVGDQASGDSTPHAGSAIAASTATGDTAALDESMIFWLESTLGIDETCTLTATLPH